MEYKTYTQEVTEIIQQSENYPLVDLHLRVDATGFILVKTAERKYYQRIFTREEMKLPAKKLSELIINEVNDSHANH